ncbi:MAG: hypothetical protein Kow006_14550 [Gammaproteobacteria bacterium]
MEPAIVETKRHPFQLESLSVTAANRAAAVRWLALGVAALGGAGLFAVVLVLSRAPFVSALFPNVDLFRVSLVVHVDLSVLIWFLAFGCVIWSLAQAGDPERRGPGFVLAAGGTLLVALSPLLGAGIPSLNNYVPVLQEPWFLAGLAVFSAGVLLQVVTGLHSGPPLRQGNVLVVGAYTAQLAVLVAAVSLVFSWLQLRGAPYTGQAYYELLFWAPGHTLQFAYTQLLMVTWLWLAVGSGVAAPLGSGALVVLLWLGLLPVAAVPLLQLMTEIGGAEQRLAFTRLMQFGGIVPAVPVGVALLVACWRAAPPEAANRPVRAALHASLLLFGVGGVVGFLIRDVNTVIPAHYHGSIAGVTMAFMGATYHLLPRLGFGRPRGRVARWQPWVYTSGQLLHVAGLALSGFLGIQRKTAGAAQGLDSVTKATMGVMGLGGLLAIIGGVLFVVVVLLSLRRRGGGEEF